MPTSGVGGKTSFVRGPVRLGILATAGVPTVPGFTPLVEFTAEFSADFSIDVPVSVGAAAGVGAASGVGKQIIAGIGTSAGIGAAPGIGAPAILTGVATSAGAGADTGVGSEIAASVATSAGTGASVAIGSALVQVVASAAGVGAAAGTGSETATSVATSVGSSTVAGVGVATVFPTSVAVAAGVGAAAGVGTPSNASVATAAGVGAASGVSAAVQLAIGTTAGVGVATAVGAGLVGVKNLIPDSNNTGAATGDLTSGGVLPFLPTVTNSGWTFNNQGSLSVIVVGTGIIGGLPYIDIHVTGVTNTTFAYLVMGDFAIAASTVYTASLSTQLLLGSNANITFAQIQFDTSTGTVAAPVYQSTPNTNGFIIPGTLTQFAVTGTSPALATVGDFNFSLWFDGTGLPVDATFRIAGVQAELGAVATSFQPTPASIVGSAAGVGVASGIGRSTNVSVAASVGTGVAAGAGTIAGVGVGTAAGVGAATASGAGSTGTTAVATATGVGVAAGVGRLTAASVASAAGVGAAIGAPGGTAAGTAAGTGAANAVGTFTGTTAIQAIASAAGTGTALAVGSIPVDTSTIGRATDLTYSIDAKTLAIYGALAADAYRAKIQQVPGAGSILGVVAMAFDGVDQVFAFRATVANTAVQIYRDSPSGWLLVPFHNLVSFTAGDTAVPLDGDTLTQGGVTATIRRVMWQSGAWAGSAIGQFVVASPVGGNFSAGAATTTSGATVTLAGPQTPIKLAAGGRFEFDKCNFSGQLVTRRIYGCDGVNPAFEFDGVTLAPITTGNVPDRPSHIKFHKNFLFLSQDASLFFSAAGNPFKWSAVDGAGEIATGDTVTGMITLPGSQTTATLGVYLRTNTAFLYGTDPTTFNFVTFNNGIGAAPYSIQNLFDTFFLDNLGVVTLKTTLNWGNFLPSTLTKNILPFIQRERGNLTASSVKREKSQYRLFFNDGYALYCTIHNQQYLGAMPVLFPDPLTCVDTTNLLTDEEATYAGSQSGYVHQLDKGTSFDGEPISAYMVTAWDTLKSPRVLKRFRAASIEVQGDNYAEFNYGYQLGYGSGQLAQLPGIDLPLNFASIPLWDSFTWDAFVWDGGELSPTDIDETGTAENVSVTISSGTNYIGAYTVDSIIHHYSMRRGMRV